MPRKHYKPKSYQAVIYSKEVLLKDVAPDVKEDGSHSCMPLACENEKRVREGESPVHVFQDIENCQWNIRVGLEFIETKFCAFCGETLC